MAAAQPADLRHRGSAERPHVGENVGLDRLGPLLHSQHNHCLDRVLVVSEDEEGICRCPLRVSWGLPRFLCRRGS